MWATWMLPQAFASPAQPLPAKRPSNLTAEPAFPESQGVVAQESEVAHTSQTEVSVAKSAAVETGLPFTDPPVSPVSKQPMLATFTPPSVVQDRIVTPVSTVMPARMPASATSDESMAAKPVVRLVIAGVRPGKGLLRVAIFTDPATFPQPASASKAFTLRADKSVIESEITLAGRSAVGVYQDLDGDGQLTVNRLGIPLEPFAFSNNAMGQRGPPKFADAAIDTSAPATAGPMLVTLNLP